jgi:hypothetical protein
MSEDKTNESKFNWSGFAGGIGVILLASGVSWFWNQPQEQSRESDERLASSIAILRGRLDADEERLRDAETIIERLRIQVEEGTGDRFKGKDAAALERYFGAIHERLEREDAWLKQEIERVQNSQNYIFEYRTEQDRHNETLEALNGSKD